MRTKFESVLTWNFCFTHSLNDKGTLGHGPSRDMKFFDASFTFSQKKIQVGCCAKDKTLTNVTCGQGASCQGKHSHFFSLVFFNSILGQCSAIKASLCPSGKCTGNPEDCDLLRLLDAGEENENFQRFRSCATASSSQNGRCYPKCRVRKNPCCCYNPKCYAIRKELCCNVLDYVTGNVGVQKLLFNCSNFQGTPVQSQAAYPMERGRVNSRVFLCRRPTSWTLSPESTPVREALHSITVENL